jgi:hypothetical protein
LLVKRGQFGRFHEISEDGRNWHPAGDERLLFPETPELGLANRPGVRAAQPRSNSVLPVDHTNLESAGKTPVSDRDGGFAFQTGTMHPDGWYYLSGEHTVGPISAGELLEVVQLGQLGRDDYVWHEQFPDWQIAARIPDLATVISNTHGRITTQHEPAGSASVSSPVSSKAAAVSLIFGLLGIAPLPIIGGIVAVTLGHRAMNAIERGAVNVEHRTFAILGVVFGYAGLALWGLIAVTMVVVIAMRR